MRKKIKGYENYEVDSLGNVYTLNYKRTGRERKLKPDKNKFGYLQVNLYRNGKVKKFYIHRLVAISFIENKYNKPQVNHINEIKNDNRVDNLNWMTAKENIMHSFSGSKSYNYKPKNYYKNKTTSRSDFKRICKKQNWIFEDFEEVYSGEKYKTHRKYYYIYKNSIKK